MIIRGRTVDVKCKRGCGVVFPARVADVKRGWGTFASKSCKAKYQEKRTGQYSAHIHEISSRENRLYMLGMIQDKIIREFHPAEEDFGSFVGVTDFSNEGLY